MEIISFLIIVVTAIIIFLIGFMVISVFGFLKDESIIGKLAYSWGLGVGLIGLQLFLYSILKINWSRVSILLPWGILFSIFLFKARKEILSPTFFTLNPALSSSKRTCTPRVLPTWW